MAYITQVGTTTSNNQNISSALLVHTQTNTTRIRKLWVNVFIDQVAGGGDYIAHIEIQRAGAGSFYTSIKTTLALAAAVTSGYFGSIPITLNATDVMRVYVKGLAGDTVTPDIIVDVNEEWQDTSAAGVVSADVKLWLAVAPAALSANGYVQAMLLRWLTDNAAGTPDALSTNKLPADVKLWLASAPAALTASGYLQTVLLRWLTDNAAGTPLVLTAANLVQADAIKLNGAVPTNLAAGAQMDLINAPNALAVAAIQSGLATLAKLLEYAKALARKDAGATSADIAGTYNNLTDSLEATSEAVALLAPGAPVDMNVDITEVSTS